MFVFFIVKAGGNGEKTIVIPVLTVFSVQIVGVNEQANFPSSTILD